MEIWHRLGHMYVSCPGGKLPGKLGGGVSREVVREIPVKIYLARETNFTETSLTTFRQTSRRTSRGVLEDVSATFLGMKPLLLPTQETQI